MGSRRTLDCGGLAPVLLGAIFLLGAWELPAQQPKSNEIPTFEFSAVQLGSFELPSYYFLEVKLDADGKPQQTYKALPVSNGARSPSTTISLVPPVSLYTGRFDEEGKPQMKPAIDIPAKSPNDRLLLVFHPDAQGNPRQAFLDDSAAAHPAETVRMANFSDQAIAFSVGDKPIIVPPHEDRFATPKTNEEFLFSFKHYTQKPDKTAYESPNKMLRFRSPGSRLLVLYASLPVETHDGQNKPDGSSKPTISYQPIAYRLYDKLN